MNLTECVGEVTEVRFDTIVEFSSLSAVGKGLCSLTEASREQGGGEVRPGGFGHMNLI